jgi:predicted small lipoprotein YifL
VTRRPRAVTLVLITSALLTIAACGQMGPLTLPTEIPADEDEQGEDEQGEDEDER